MSVNKQRREMIRNVVQSLHRQTNVLELVLDQESEIMSNWPENLQNTERYIQCEDSVDGLETATSLITEAIPYLEGIVTG